MNTYLITITLVLVSMTTMRGETSVPLQSVNYIQLQREMRANAQLAAEQAETMARLARYPYNTATHQRIHAADLRRSVNAALDRATRLAITLPYETFNSPEGVRLMQSITKLSAAAAEALDYVKESPTKVQSGTYVALLERVRDICEEMTE